MSAIVEGLQAITIHVRDLDVSRKFYAEVLGLEEDRGVVPLPRVVFKLPGTSTRLSMHVQGEGEGGREPGTVTGVLFHSADPAAACAAITGHGGRVTHEPWTIQRGPLTVTRAVFADPDGNEFLLSSSI